MTLVPTNPIVIDGETYPLYSASLAIYANYVNGDMNASAAMRLIPTRLDSNNNPILSQENSVNLTLGSATEAGPDEQMVMGTIHNAIQNYIFQKGL